MKPFFEYPKDESEEKEIWVSDTIAGARVVFDVFSGNMSGNPQGVYYQA